MFFNKRNYLIFIGLMFFVFLIFKLPIVVTNGSDIRNMNFISYYDKLSQHIPRNHNYIVEDIYLLFNGKSGTIEKFNCRVVSYTKNEKNICNIKYWPMLKITTITQNHISINEQITNNNGVSPKELFNVLNYLDYEGIFKANAYFYTILSSFEYKSRIFHSDSNRENFMLSGRNLIRLKNDIYYPEAYEILLYGNNKLKRSYLFK